MEPFFFTKEHMHKKNGPKTESDWTPEYKSHKQKMVNGTWKDQNLKISHRTMLYHTCIKNYMTIYTNIKEIGE